MYRQHPPASASLTAKNSFAHELANIFASFIPTRNWGHAKCSIGFQQGEQSIHVGGFPGMHITIELFPKLFISRGFDAFTLQCVMMLRKRGAGAMQGTLN